MGFGTCSGLGQGLRAGEGRGLNSGTNDTPSLTPRWAHELSPELVMRTLNDLYSRLDDIILNEMPGLYKVETIGDAYMVRVG